MQKRIIKAMKLLYFVVDLFINTFGITQPTERARKKAAFFILGLIVLAILLAGSAGVVVHSAMR